MGRASANRVHREQLTPAGVGATKSGADTAPLLSRRPAEGQSNATARFTLGSPTVEPTYPKAGLTAKPSFRPYPYTFLADVCEVVREDDLLRIFSAMAAIERNPSSEVADRFAFTDSDGCMKVVDRSTGTFVLTYTVDSDGGGVVFQRCDVQGGAPAFETAAGDLGRVG